MADKKTSKIITSSSSSTTPDPAAAKKAFDALTSQIEAIAHSDVVPGRVDIGNVVIAVLAVGRFIADPKVHALFVLLPEQLFNHRHLADLEPRGLALSYAHIQLQTARAQTTEAKLPVALVDEATAVKDRMLDLAEYHFKRDPALSKEVASIKIGTGYKDLASDLERLANLYQAQKAVVATDPVNYRETDEAEARTLAQRILKELGEAQSAEERKWSDLTARAWTLVLATYSEVQAAGMFLYRKDKGEERFPSLYAVGRAAPVRKEKKSPVEAEPVAGTAATPTAGTMAPLTPVGPAVAVATPAAQVKGA